MGQTDCWPPPSQNKCKTNTPRLRPTQGDPSIYICKKNCCKMQQNGCTAKTHLYSLSISQISPTFSFTLFQLTVSAISSHHFCSICSLPAWHCRYLKKTCKHNPLRLMVFKINIWKGALVTCIFKNWLFADWGLAGVSKFGINFGINYKILWCRPLV